MVDWTRIGTGSLELALEIQSTVRMSLDDFSAERLFRQIWTRVRIVRSVEHGLFTFGNSELPYYLVVEGETPGEPVKICRGTIEVTRPLLITPGSAGVELEGFFEEEDADRMVRFLLARTAGFSHVKLERHEGPVRMISDSTEEVVSRLNRELDLEDEDRVAVLTAPHGLGKFAVLKYALQRIIDSTPGNIQELRERGFLPPSF